MNYSVAKRLCSETPGKLYSPAAFNHIFCVYYNFVSTTSSLSKFRNSTHVITRMLARPVENKVLIDVFLVEEIIDCVPKLVQPDTPTRK